MNEAPFFKTFFGQLDSSDSESYGTPCIRIARELSASRALLGSFRLCTRSVHETPGSKMSDTNVTPTNGGVSARACLSLDQLHPPKKISCTTLKVDMIPIRHESRPTTHMSTSHSGYSDSVLSMVEGKSLLNRSTPIPELNLASVVTQSQANLNRQILYGTYLSNSTALRKSSAPASQTQAKYRIPFVASHTWNSNIGLGPLGELQLSDDPTVMRFESLQRNRITKIDHLYRLTQLVFLDLSHNQVGLISGLDQLHELRVLLLGQNHIRRIEGLEQQRNLEVLDLQRNGIQKIENIAHLSKLRVLNLAMNGVVFLNGLSGLISLTEVNLRQNNIVKIEPLSNLPRLSWIQLSFNNIERWSQISGLSKLPATAKVVLDGNPIVMDPSYRRLMPTQMALTPEVENSHQNSRVYRCARQTSHIISSQLPLGMVTTNTPGTEVYDVSQIHLRIPEVTNNVNDKHNVTGQNGAGGALTLQPVELEGLAAGDHHSKSASITKVTDLPANKGTNCVSAAVLSTESFQRIPSDTSRSDSPPTEPPTSTKPQSKSRKRTMTDESFLRSHSEICQISVIHWQVVDRTHIRFEAKLYNDDPEGSLLLTSAETTGFKNLGAALNDLAFAVKSADRLTPSNSYPTKATNLTQVTQISLYQITWNDFIGEIPQIRIIFPELKCLTIRSVGLKKLIDIVALTRLRRLESLIVDPGAKNPIVQQAGQFWRPFVIWSLKDALDLRHLDRVEVRSEQWEKFYAIYFP
ncbi:unnamed protein product [Echinostoma caproni]|uniref:Leucine-rich repeat-containing protein 49 n=1 Tax=Echinostoma caproni TaxID=27848 RepID=A0A183AMI7_9TREM|nr:unnamed protein product [Echinostoma caproni]